MKMILRQVITLIPHVQCADGKKLYSLKTPDHTHIALRPPNGVSNMNKKILILLFFFFTTITKSALENN